MSLFQGLTPLQIHYRRPEPGIHLVFVLQEGSPFWHPAKSPIVSLAILQLLVLKRFGAEFAEGKFFFLHLIEYKDGNPGVCLDAQLELDWEADQIKDKSGEFLMQGFVIASRNKDLILSIIDWVKKHGMPYTDTVTVHPRMRLQIPKSRVHFPGARPPTRTWQENKLRARERELDEAFRAGKRLAVLGEEKYAEEQAWVAETTDQSPK
ncbi:hypothetical protein ACOYR4_15335 [Acidovorax sp. M14]|uniref:hypothetical protein n=1 Tax=Acidovorax sp. M14 TaxID=3411354 RepID=UPI003BF46779